MIGDGATLWFRAAPITSEESCHTHQVDPKCGPPDPWRQATHTGVIAGP